MRVPHWCQLGVTILLLVCEISISQVCKSFITLVDGFHTLFILMHMALPRFQNTNKTRAQLPSLASPPHASSFSSALPYILTPKSSSEPLPCLQMATDESTIPVKCSTPQPHHEAASVVYSHEIFSSSSSPPARVCGMSYTKGRTQALGAFLSALLLASLCISCLMEIVSFHLEPHPVQHPLLLVAVGVGSLLHNMMVLGLNWGQLRGNGAEAGRERETEFYLEVNHKALAEEETRVQTEQGRVPDDLSKVQSAVESSLHNGALVLCNTATSSIPDTDSQTADQRPEVHLHAAAAQDCRHLEVVGTVTDLRACKHESRSEEISKDNTCREHLDSHDATPTSDVCTSTHHTESHVPSSQWPVCSPTCVLVIQSMLTPVLAVINSLVMLLIDPNCRHTSGPCSLLVYLDPGFSVLAVIILIARATPQVHRYALLLLQATPPHICVSDVEQRIGSVPGIEAVHDLHIWELNDSFIVASVHVHCHAGFPAHRCADLMLGVTKVLQSVGVSCCTVQPEFVAFDASSAGSQGGPTLPPVLACSFACGKVCVGKTCCTPGEEDHRNLLAPVTEETKEKSETVVIYSEQNIKASINT